MHFLLGKLKHCKEICRVGVARKSRVCSFSSEGSNASQDGPKISKPPEFSKSHSYPTRLKLRRIEQEETTEAKISPAVRNGARLILLGILVFYVYAAWFGDYNLEYEENMARQVPGYVEYMKKIDKNYEEHLRNLKAKNAVTPAGDSK